MRRYIKKPNTCENKKYDNKSSDSTTAEMFHHHYWLKSVPYSAYQNNTVAMKFHIWPDKSTVIPCAIFCCDSVNNYSSMLKRSQINMSQSAVKLYPRTRELRSQWCCHRLIVVAPKYLGFGKGNLIRSIRSGYVFQLYNLAHTWMRYRYRPT